MSKIKVIFFLCVVIAANFMTTAVFASTQDNIDSTYERAKQAVKNGKNANKVQEKTDKDVKTNAKDAQERIRREVAAKSEKPEVYVERGKVFDELKEYNNAIANYDFAIYLNPKLWQAYYQRALDRHIIGEHEKALEDLEQVLKLNPKYAQAHYQRALVLISTEDYIDAILSFEKAANTSAVLKGKAEQGMGIANYYLKQYSVATKNFEAAALLEPIDAANYVWLGRLKSEARDYKAALEFYNKALVVNPNSSEAYLFKGRVLAFFMKNYEEGIITFTKAIELNPDYADAYLQRAYAYNQTGNGKMAKADFDKAVSLNPDLKEQVLPAYRGDAKNIPQTKPEASKRIVVTAGQ